MLSLMRDNPLGESGIDHIDDLVAAFARLLHRHAEAGEFLRHADGSADFEASAREKVEQSDLLDDARGMIIGQHDPHHAEPQFARALSHGGDQKVR